jgi:hypothetical protein
MEDYKREPGNNNNNKKKKSVYGKVTRRKCKSRRLDIIMLTRTTISNTCCHILATKTLKLAKTQMNLCMPDQIDNNPLASIDQNNN